MHGSKLQTSYKTYICRSAVAVLFLLTAKGSLANQCNVVNGQAYGDCTNVDLVSADSSPLYIRSNVGESGIISGATVTGLGTLRLTGISNGDISVQSGGHLDVSGVVNGTIYNHGGHVIVEGTVQAIQTDGGTVELIGIANSVSGKGHVIYRKNAVVGGVPVSKSSE